MTILFIFFSIFKQNITIEFKLCKNKKKKEEGKYLTTHNIKELFLFLFHLHYRCGCVDYYYSVVVVFVFILINKMKRNGV
jgi:uncharacterized protein YqhQ